MDELIEFSGTVLHQIDEKGRMRIPSRFMSPDMAPPKDKDEVVRVWVVAGSENFFSVYSVPEMAEKRRALAEIPDSTNEIVQAKRKIYASMALVDVDRQGRILIPPTLRAYAKINKELISVGMNNHFEVWAKEEYEAQNMITTFTEAQSTVKIFF